jgi:hypothetical protein
MNTGQKARKNTIELLNLLDEGVLDVRCKKIGKRSIKLPLRSRSYRIYGILRIQGYL